MSHCPTLWNVLHDGEITDVTGSVPGVVVLRVEIDYLRRRFREEGERFVVTLAGCTRFSFVPWADEQTRLTTPGQLQGIPVVILSADAAGSYCRVHCDPGTLEIAAENASVSPDSGRAVPLEELIRVADEYWQEWEHRRTT